MLSGADSAVRPKLQIGFAGPVEGAASEAGCPKDAAWPNSKLDLGFDVVSSAFGSEAAFVSRNLKVGAVVDVVEGAFVDLLPKLNVVPLEAD